MAPIKNSRHIFNEVPTGYPEPGKTLVQDDSQTIDLENVPLNGGVLIKSLVVSIDPYLRNRLRLPVAGADPKQYGATTFALGQALYNFGVGVVLRSDNPAYKTGDHVYGTLLFQEYFVADKDKKFKVLQKPDNLSWSVYVGAAGMPGQTAYYGWKEFAHPKQGETAFVTTGAGAVGSLVIQLAKKDGLKVIASAGSDEKVQYMKDLGADVAFNYKTTSTKEILEKEGPIDIYWDHVGGETFQHALDNANTFARFIECGMIASYNGQKQEITNLMPFVSKQIRLSGFIVGSLSEKYQEEFYEAAPKKLASGEWKFKEDISYGLETVGQAMYDVQTGANNGKKIIVIAEE